VVVTHSTPHFRIVDSASSPAALIDSLKASLEADWVLVGTLLPEFQPPADTILMIIRPGTGFPSISGARAVIAQFVNNGTLSFSYIPHQLTHVWTRYQRRPFLEEGLAVYVTTLAVPPESHPMRCLALCMYRFKHGVWRGYRTRQPPARRNTGSRLPATGS